MSPLLPIAAALTATTKTAARAALKAAGLKQSLADDLLAAAAALAEARRAKRSARIARRLGYTPINPSPSWHTQGNRSMTPWWREPTHPGRILRPVVRIPLGTPAERLTNLRQAEVLRMYCSGYRTPAADHGSETVVLTTDPAAVGIRQHVDQEWGAYSRSCRYPKQITNTTITVPADWRVRVQRRSLAMVDGMLTLDAAPMPAPDGIALDAAVWLVQGRGYTVTAERGYIARSAAGSYHGATAQAALDGLARKIRARDLAAKWDAIIAAHGLDGLAAAAPTSAVVRIADATAIGACDYGIRSWCHATGLPYEAGQAPVADVLAAYRREPRSEARAAILHALRRYRSVARLAA